MTVPAAASPWLSRGCCSPRRPSLPAGSAAPVGRTSLGTGCPRRAAPLPGSCHPGRLGVTLEQRGVLAGRRLAILLFVDGNQLERVATKAIARRPPSSDAGPGARAATSSWPGPARRSRRPSFGDPLVRGWPVSRCCSPAAASDSDSRSCAGTGGTSQRSDPGPIGASGASGAIGDDRARRPRSTQASCGAGGATSGRALPPSPLPRATLELRHRHRQESQRAVAELQDQPVHAPGAFVGIDARRAARRARPCRRCAR